MLKCFYIDLVIQISSERNVKKNFETSLFECFEGPLGDILRTSWRRPESISQGRPLKVTLGRPQGIRLERPRTGQIESLEDVLGTLELDVLGTPWGPIFAGWVISTIYMLWHDVKHPLT